jgi:hypothetical protein
MKVASMAAEEDDSYSDDVRDFIQFDGLDPKPFSKHGLMYMHARGGGGGRRRRRRRNSLYSSELQHTWMLG